jgi:hypothetical protein
MADKKPPAGESEFARMAREVAETTERAARAAMERATDVASRLEQMSAERDFLQGLQSEAEKTRAEAQEAAQVVEGLRVGEACSAEIEAEEEAVAAAALTSGEVDISPATPSSARTEMQ